MRILVCVKQVPDMESRFRPNSQGTWFEETDLAWRMNEYDEYAVEQAMLLKEQLGGEPVVTVLSVGPERVLDVIRKGMAMGCDSGVHILDDDVSAKDPWQVAGCIASFAEGEGFDLIFTGLQSQDRGSAQVGVLVAEKLGISCVTTLVGFSYENGVVTARRELEGGAWGVIKLRPPALFTCQSGLNVPRYPTLPNILRSRKKEIRTIRVEELVIPSPLSVTTGVYPPVRREGVTFLEGEIALQIDRLMDILRGKCGVMRK